MDFHEHERLSLTQQNNNPATVAEEIIAASHCRSLLRQGIMGGPSKPIMANGDSSGSHVDAQYSLVGSPEYHHRMITDSLFSNGYLRNSIERKGIAGLFPQFFSGKVCRARLETCLADDPPDPCSHTWVELISAGTTQHGSSKRQMYIYRQLIKFVVLSHLLVFNSNRLLTQSLRDLLALSVDFPLFNQLRNEAYMLFTKYENEFLWEGFFPLIGNMLECHGQAVTGDFRLDPDVWERTEENLRHTEQFLLDTLDKNVWLEYFDMFEGLADWDAVFADRDALPFFFISTLYTTICFEMVQVVLNERRLNPAEPEDIIADTKGKGKALVSAAPGAADVKNETLRWYTDPEGRVHMHCFLELMGGYPDFANVELDSIPWFQWKAPTTKALLSGLSKQTMQHRYIKKNVPTAVVRSQLGSHPLGSLVTD